MSVYILHQDCRNRDHNCFCCFHHNEHFYQKFKYHFDNNTSERQPIDEHRQSGRHCSWDHTAIVASTAWSLALLSPLKDQTTSSSDPPGPNATRPCRRKTRAR